LWPEACDSADCEKPLARFELVVPRLVHEQTQGAPSNGGIGTDEFGLHGSFDGAVRIGTLPNDFGFDASKPSFGDGIGRGDRSPKP
jgi:hypothetical protein